MLTFNVFGRVVNRLKKNREVEWEESQSEFAIIFQLLFNWNIAKEETRKQNNNREKIWIREKIGRKEEHFRNYFVTGVSNPVWHLLRQTNFHFIWKIFSPLKTCLNRRWKVLRKCKTCRTYHLTFVVSGCKSSLFSSESEKPIIGLKPLQEKSA